MTHKDTKNLTTTNTFDISILVGGLSTVVLVQFLQRWHAQLLAGTVDIRPHLVTQHLSDEEEAGKRKDTQFVKENARY